MVAQLRHVHSSEATPLERWAFGALVVMLAAAVLFAADRTTFESFAYAMLVVGHATAGALLLRYGRRTESADGKSFQLLGVAAFLGAAGVVAFGIAAELVDLPSFGPLDAIFLVMYGTLLASLAYMPAPRQSWRAQVRLVVDGMVGAISISALLWVGLGERIMDNLGQLPLEQRLIGFTYPLLDLALVIGVMVVILRRGQFRFDVRLLLIVIGFGFQVAADLSYLATSTTGLFVDAEPNFLLFLGAATSFLLAGMLAARVPAPVEVPDRKTPIWAYAAPYGIGIVLGAVTVLRDLTVEEHNTVMTVATFVVLFLVIARQWLSIQENHVVVEKERRSLIASVSHELRTPLTSMIGFLTLLEDAESDISEQERAELRAVVLEQANYMGRMVTDIILLARDQPESLTLVETPVSAGEFVESILDTLGGKASNTVVDVDDEMILTIDVDRVRQVATNLITNAVRYGGGETVLVVREVANDLVLEVHDDGEGVPKKHEVTIWERFERGPHKLNSAKPGTGLGLAIVEMIARAHDGTAGYRRSERLGGACFFVRLPGRVHPADADEGSVTTASQPASARSR